MADLTSRTGLQAGALPLFSLERSLSPLQRKLGLPPHASSSSNLPQPPKSAPHSPCWSQERLLIGILARLDHVTEDSRRITRRVDSLMAEITYLRESIASPSNWHATDFTGRHTLAGELDNHQRAIPKRNSEPKVRHCGTCGEPGHNARTCQLTAEPRT
jgi:hypothetical protein